MWHFVVKKIMVYKGAKSDSVRTMAWHEGYERAFTAIQTWRQRLPQYFSC